MIKVYQLLGYLLIPIIKINIYFRLLTQKEDNKRFGERYGISKIKRPKGKLIWIHAASVGEFKSVSKLIDKLHNNFNILVTTTTVTAANYAYKNFGNKIIHQFAPFDINIWVNRFLNKWKPSLVLWIESDLWPVTLNLIKKKSIKSILLNSRISPKSFNKWKYIKFFFRIMISTFDEIFAQSQLDKKRLEFLSKRKINFIGNLKLASIEKLNNENEFNKLQKKFINYKVIMFASTHADEEKIFISSIKKLLNKYKNIKFIIAPRHPRRSQSIVNMFNKNSIVSSLFDKSKNFDEKVFIINTFGKMTLYYYLSEIVILGGSFIKMGGHNPIEPACNNCIVITGPHIYNWENIFLDMINNSACFLCNNISEVENNIMNLLEDQNKAHLVKTNAKNFVNNSFFEIEKLLLKINNYLDEIKC